MVLYEYKSAFTRKKLGVDGVNSDTEGIHPGTHI